MTVGVNKKWITLTLDAFKAVDRLIVMVFLKIKFSLFVLVCIIDYSDKGGGGVIWKRKRPIYATNDSN